MGDGIVTVTHSMEPIDLPEVENNLRPSAYADLRQAVIAQRGYVRS